LGKVGENVKSVKSVKNVKNGKSVKSVKSGKNLKSGKNVKSVKKVMGVKVEKGQNGAWVEADTGGNEDWRGFFWPKRSHEPISFPRGFCVMIFY
jgi:hypothetical protein